MSELPGSEDGRKLLITCGVKLEFMTNLSRLSSNFYRNQESRDDNLKSRKYLESIDMTPHFINPHVICISIFPSAHKSLADLSLFSQNDSIDKRQKTFFW